MTKPVDKELYEMLKRVGHSPAKALEIVIDHSRGVQHAKDWVTAVAALASTEVRP